MTPSVKIEKRSFTTTIVARVQEKQEFQVSTSRQNSYTQPAAEQSQNVTEAEKNHFDRIEEESKQKQMRSPWMREGSEKPPVARNRSAGAMTKGKLLSTPSRMLKLILPLTTRDANKDRKDVEPLALLVHPQQPLSYLERLIQSELPMLEDGGKERVPSVVFRAEDSTEEDIRSGTPAVDEIEDAEETMVDGKLERTGKIKSSKDEQLPTHGHEESKRPVDTEHP